MFRMTRFLLLTMVAILVLGFSVTANAVKDKPQIIRSGAIAGYYHICHATNIADRDIYVTWKIFRETGYQQADKVEWVAPGETYSLNMITASFSRCEISWEGEPGEIRGTVCTYFAENQAANIGACLDLY